jgi:hypothetical protein
MIRTSHIQDHAPHDGFGLSKVAGPRQGSPGRPGLSLPPTTLAGRALRRYAGKAKRD